MDPHDTEEFLNELLEKWQDAYATSDDWVEKNLSVEFLEDLHDLEKILHG